MTQPAPDSSNPVNSGRVANNASGLDQPTRPLGPAHYPGVQIDRWNRGAWLFRDTTLRSLEILLDEAFRIPGTQIRFGIDGIIGLVPGLGDVVAGLLSLIIPFAAWMRGVPYITLARMAVNLAIGVLVGSIPFFGDMFDIAWKANRRNYRLMQVHLREPRRHSWRDWAFLAILVVAIGLVFAIPVLLAIWMVVWILHR